jgi:hypothetical protein
MRGCWSAMIHAPISPRSSGLARAMAAGKLTYRCGEFLRLMHRTSVSGVSEPGQ